MENNFKMEPLKLIYIEIHHHMRENFRKRDQFIAFYISLLAAYFIGIEKNEEIKIIALVFLFLFGIFLFNVLMQYRKWHLVYNNDLVIFENLLTKNNTDDVDLNICKELHSKLNDNKTLWSNIYPFNGIEASTYFTFVFIVCIPFHLLMKNIGMPLIINWPPLAFIINMLIVYCIAFFIAKVALKKCNELNENNWTYRWLRNRKT